MTDRLKRDAGRMRQVLDHIDRHLDGDLSLEALSTVASSSKFHFHRQFKAHFGIALHRYVQLARMRRASKRLTNAEGARIIEIALDAGYETPDAFARAFRKRFRQSPSGFRNAPDWDSWRLAFGPLNEARSQTMQTKFTPDQVTIRDVAPIRVALFEHHGDPATIEVTVQRFIAWRQSAGLPPRTHATFNIWHTEHQPEDPANYRMDLAVAVQAGTAVKGDGVRIGTIPGGRCAVLRVTGQTHDLEPAARYLYRDWLPASGETLRDFPIYCQRLFLDQPERGSAAELFLPLR